ncbi:MAG: HAMP domain-containing sensor histidine kinase [Myxococcota bacterium]
MKLVTRLTVAFLLVELLVISLHEVRRLKQELVDFQRDMDRTHLLVATSLADAIELVAPREGLDAARRTLETTAQRQGGDIRIRWVCMPGSQDVPPAPVGCEQLAKATLPVTVTAPEGAASERRFTLAPLAVAGAASGAIEVSEAPEHEGAWATQHFDEALLLALMTVVATTALAFVLGLWLVASPTRKLVEKARAVGRGELDPPLRLAATDELGDLAKEMNAMCAHLKDARESTARAAQARLEALEQLRHADRLATVGRLASGLAHELGTPLNVVEARAGLILDDATAEDPVKDSARVIITCAEQMTRLVRQLLVFARERRVEKGPMQLDALGRTVVELVRPVAAKQQVTVETGTLESAPVLADEVLLQQAVTNLVMNAAQACGAGGHVTVTVGLRDTTPPGDATPKRWAVLEVKDDGSGMAPEVKARVFEPFFTTKEPGEGTGLGLAVAWGIVEDHGGFIAVDSAPGQGSTFTIHLPGGAP